MDILILKIYCKDLFFTTYRQYAHIYHILFPCLLYVYL